LDLWKFDTGLGAVLYRSDAEAAGQNWFGFLLPTDDPAAAPESIPLAESWSDYWGNPLERQNGGCYVFFPQAPTPGAATDLAAVLADLNGQISGGLAYRYLLWFDQVGGMLPALVGVVPFASPNATFVPAFGSVRLRNLSLGVGQGIGVGFDGAQPAIILSPLPGVPLRLTSTVDTPTNIGAVGGPAVLALGGPRTGGLGFPIVLTVLGQKVSNDFATLNVGVKYFYSADGLMKSQLFPILGLPRGQSQLPFTARLDPIHPTDEARTRFTFGPAGLGPLPAFATALLTDMGLALTLTPVGDDAGFALAPDRTTPQQGGGEQVDTYYGVLSGDYVLGLAAEIAGTAVGTPLQLLCGLSGIETVSVLPTSESYPGDVLRFSVGQAAFAPVFPITPASLGSPGQARLSQPALDRRMTTAWVSFRSGSAGAGQGGLPNQYFTQAKGSPQFVAGNESLPAFLGLFLNPSADLGPGCVFPMVAYQGLTPTAGPGGFDASLVADFEQQILSPARWARIVPPKAGPATPRPRPAESPGPTVSVTPQGFLVTVEGGLWSSLVLAQNASEVPPEVLQFLNLDPSLQHAFEANELFLVVTKAAWSTATAAAGPVFANRISIEGWPFVLNTGVDQGYGDYSNVLIFKFCSGRVVDRAANPRLWTAPEAFNNVANDELLAVSGWLGAYFDAAAAQPAGAGFDHFNRIVKDGAWNGILALKVDIETVRLPSQVEALAAGLDLDRFHAHHVGIEVNPIALDGQGRPQIDGDSSLFGLISYVDPAYAQALGLGAGPETPIPPAPGPDYDFKVLSLRVLFENTAIKDFQSRCQVTLNRWFGDAVRALRLGDGGNLSNSIVLDGVLQRRDGHDTYVFRSGVDAVFLLQGNVLSAVEVVATELNTVTAGAGGLAIYRFAFSGFLNFAPIAGFDAFSFGGNAGELSGVGLAYSNLFLDLAFDPRAPTARTFAFNLGQVAFDVKQSSPRPASLYGRFPLKLRGLVQGADNKPPSQQGFLPVKVEGAVLGGLGDPWYGLTFELDLGTPGALAAGAGWRSSLVLAWSPPGRQVGGLPKAFVGLQLPGTGNEARLLSLQGILKLSIQDITFRFIPEGGAYLLKMTDIAVKLLGLKFPPSGGTVFYLFGDPARSEGSSDLGWYAAYNQEPPLAAPDGGRL